MRTLVKQRQGPTEEQEDRYDEEVKSTREDLRALAALLAVGTLSVAVFEQRMRDKIRQHLVTIAIIASDGDFDPDDELDLADLGIFLTASYAFLSGFVTAIQEEAFSEAYLQWRSGLYAGARHVFIRYSIPRDIMLLMPVLPGIDCLGGHLCGCTLFVDEFDDGTVEVIWEMDPAKEHCVVCLDAESQSPYVFSP